MKLLENIPLAPLTTLGVGGPARYFIELQSAEDAAEAVVWAQNRKLPLFVLGGGSNLVVADEGFTGLVAKMAIRGVSEKQEDGLTLLTAGAGEDWDGLVARAVEAELAGLECLSGIPGTVGATPVQNVGAYGQEVSETIYSVEALDLTTGEMRSFTNDECGFGYRTSRFNSCDRGRYIIMRVTFALQPGARPKLAYADLRKAFAGSQPTLAEVRRAVCDVRRSKGMVLVEGDTDCCSAGSFFKNPVLSPADYEQLQRLASARGLIVPCYPALASQHKVPAAWLVEKAGFPRGFRRGRVGISRKHALAITNLGGAHAADIIALKTEIQESVREQFGVRLQPEPVFLGFGPECGAAQAGEECN